MKKMILGLFLTVGISATSFANTNRVLEKNIEISNSMISHEEIKLRYENDILVECTLVFITREYDNCGTLVNTHEVAIENLMDAWCGDSAGGVGYNIRRINNGFGDCRP